MYPFLPTIPALHLGQLSFGPFTIGTFGLMLWLAAVCAAIVLHKNFVRNGVDADALNVVTLTVLAGILGAKAWHELQSIPSLTAAWRQIMLPGWSHPTDILMGALRWFQAGFAWFGGLLAGVATLLWQGRVARLKGPREGVPGARLGGLRMLDLAAPAAAIGYGVGRIGCLTSGDGDYGINTTLPWGVHMAKNALVPPTPPDALVQPTPIYEFLFALALFWLIWKLGARSRPIGWITGLYLLLSGSGRFLVEFVRVNPRIYWGMSNAQVAALGSIVVGGALLLWSRKNEAPLRLKYPVPRPT